MTVYSQDSSKTPPLKIKYPVTTTDNQGTKIVIITQEQQKHLNMELVALQQCFNREMSKARLIEALDNQVNEYRYLSVYCDSTLNKVTLMLENREQKIVEQQSQINLHLQQSNIFENQILKQKRQLLGWKIGAGVAIGVTVISIPLILGFIL